MTTLEDPHLLTLLKEGDSHAVDYWFKTFRPKVTAFVATKISNSHDIEEIVQQTFVHCLKHLPLFRGGSSIWTWMCSIASHEIADFYRKQYAKKALKTIPLLDELMGESPALDAHQLSELVKKVLSQMSPNYRQLLLLKYQQLLPVSAIAEKLAKTTKSIESDLFRARQQFKALYAVVG